MVNVTAILNRLTPIEWSDLRRFGTSAVLKSSYFWLASIPIAAKLLLQLKQPFVFTFLGKEHTVFLHLPFSWYLFYFSAVAFATASALFGFYCPRIIKRYSSFGDFYGEGSGARELLSHYWSLDKKTREAVLPILVTETKAALGEQKYPAHPGNPTELAIQLQTMIRKVKREEMTDLFTALREFHDRRLPAVRVTIAIFYAIGFALITYVFLQNLVSVLKAIFT